MRQKNGMELERKVQKNVCGVGGSNRGKIENLLQKTELVRHSMLRWYGGRRRRPASGVSQGTVEEVPERDKIWDIYVPDLVEQGGSAE